jgi:hypothetical protein
MIGRHLLRCMGPFVALSGHTETVCYLSALGQKRTDISRGLDRIGRE